MKSSAKFTELKRALEPYRPERIYVFGSWAHGSQDELSDLDIVVIKRTKKPFFSRLREVARLLPPNFGAVDILVYTPEEFSRMTEQVITVPAKQTKQTEERKPMRGTR